MEKGNGGKILKKENEQSEGNGKRERERERENLVMATLRGYCHDPM